VQLELLISNTKARMASLLATSQKYAVLATYQATQKAKREEEQRLIREVCAV
jgi:hypothetical protein